MNRNLYYSGIYFLGLASLISVFESLIRFQIGAQLFTLDSYLPWVIIVTIITLIGLIILLKYCHYKNYRAVFLFGLVYVLALLSFSYIFYNILARNIDGKYYFPVYLIYLGIGILFGLSLIFSNAGKRAWLKTAGILTFTIGLTILSIMLAIWIFKFQQMQGEIEKFGQWISIIAILIPVSLIMNFLSELRLLKNERLKVTFTSVYDLLGFAGIIVLVLTIILGINLVGESSDIVRDPDEAKRLAQNFEARTYSNTEGDTMPYRLLMPLNYDPQKKYPIVVCLHGGGVRGNDNNKHILAGGPWRVLSKESIRNKYPAFIFVPQCPDGFCWGGYSNIPFMDLPAADSLVFETINALEKEFNIDKKRRYITGGSMGGYGTWHFICTRPKMFAAAIPISGAGDPDLSLNIVDVPVWAFHGHKDQPVPVSGSRDMIEAIKKAGGNPRYTEYPDLGHGIWWKVYGTPDLLDWFFSQKRD